MTQSAVPRTQRFGGIVTTAELAAAGLSPSHIRTLVHQGNLMHVYRGVYAPAGESAAGRVGPDGVEALGKAGVEALRVAGAVALAGPGSAASHRCAAIMHGLDLLEDSPAGPVTVTRPRQSHGTRTGRPGIRICPAELPAQHVTAWHGVPVTTVARTVIDLARTSLLASGVVVADSALRGGRTSKAELQAVVDDCTRWPGIAQARHVLAFSDGRSESVFESVSRVAFREQGLPPPDLQVWVGDEDGVIGRVDFLWEEFRTIGEADGSVKYANPKRALAQLQRDARLREAGFEVLHFTWRQVILVPGQVAEAIRAAFRRGKPG